MDDKSAAKVKTIQWQIHPMGDSVSKAFFFWAVVIMVIWAVYWNVSSSFSPAGSIIFTMVASFLLLLSLTSFFLPTCYSISSEGIEVKRWFYKRNFAWSRVRSATAEKSGIFISPFPVRTRLENFRGVYLIYNDNMQAVIDGIRSFAPNLAGLPVANNESSN